MIGVGQGTDNGFTGLVAYAHSDDGMGTSAKDSSAKHHAATFATDGGRPAPSTRPISC